MYNNRKLGNEKELKAAAYLSDKGYNILEMNFSVRQAEIDIVASDADGTLVFVEVKYRSTNKSGSSLEAVTFSKQKKICRAALSYLSIRNINPETTSIRFDVIGIDGDTITHIENAFQFV